MIGAIIGDIVGSRFEFNNTFDPHFDLFHRDCSFTDDTICTVAIADAILRDEDYKTALLQWCRQYPFPRGGYGGSFARWLEPPDHQPYNSYGNGAAMRVSPVGWAFSDGEVVRQAMLSAMPTHNHVEGLIGAACVAEAIAIERGGANSAYVECRWYDLAGDGIRVPEPGVFDETCQGCVPLAFSLLAGANSFEEAIRRAVAYGGDSDTLAAIVGSLAEARFGVPDELVVEAMRFLPPKMKQVITKFREKYVE